MASTSAATPFDFSTRLGLVFIVQAAGLSALAVIGVLLYITLSALGIKRGASRKWSTETHIHYYFINLMVFDLVQAAGGMMDIKWVRDTVVTQGSYCTAQGTLKQIGDVGVALTSLAIALHTFSVLIFRWRTPPVTALFIVGFIWVFITLVIGVTFATHKGEMYYGDTQYWCWIMAHYPAERIGLEYIWLWIAAFVDIIVYVFLALVVKGFVIVNGGRMHIATGEERVHKAFTSSNRSRPSGATRDHQTIATSLLFYPAVYLVTVLPIAVVRWTTFSDPDVYVPFAATAFSDILFASSGWLNVLLFAITRPKILPSREPTTTIVLESPSTPYSAGPRRIKGPHLSDLATDDIECSWAMPSDEVVHSLGKPTSLSMSV